VLVAGAAGCSNGGAAPAKPADPLNRALSYLGADSPAVFVVATDPERGPIADLDRLGAARGWRPLKRQLESSIGLAGIDLDQLRPQLGNPFALAITPAGKRVGAIHVHDPAGLRRVVDARFATGKAQRLDSDHGALAWRDRGGPPGALAYSAAVDGDLVVAQSEPDLREALDAAGGNDNLLAEQSLSSTLKRLDPRALVRVVGDAQRLLSSADPYQAADARKVPWIRALGTFAGVFEVGKHAVTVDLNVRTDRLTLAKDQLPLVPGSSAPRLHDPHAAAAIGIHRPQQLFRFLERTLAATDPGTFARLQAGEDQLRSIFGVDVHKDLVQKITNLSLATSTRRAVTFEGLLPKGAAPAFTRALDRAQPFIEGVTGDLLPSSGTVEARGAGAQRVWLVRNRRATIARYAVRGGELVGSIGSGDLPAPVRGRELPGAKGALVLKGDPAPIAPLTRLLPGVPKELVDVIPRLPNVTVAVQAETSGLVVRARVPAKGR
jgi:hypothetical protein